MTIEYVPLKQFSDRIERGWCLANELKPGDYAAVMKSPGHEKTERNKRSAAKSWRSKETEAV